MNLRDLMYIIITLYHLRNNISILYYIVKNNLNTIVYNIIYIHTHIYLHECPSGLRGTTQARMSKDAWVRTPLRVFFFDLNILLLNKLFKYFP